MEWREGNETWFRVTDFRQQQKFWRSTSPSSGIFSKDSASAGGGRAIERNKKVILMAGRLVLVDLQHRRSTILSAGGEPI
jgi:hypothetical protein